MNSPADRITLISLDQLHDSPHNPRRTFNEAGLQELATDIRANGVLSPLLVRPRVYADGLARRGDGQAEQPGDTTDGYELVYGHRRLRAAVLAGLAAVPCMVRAMPDAEARRAQISENLSRADVHPIEEAEGFRALIDDSTETADTLAQRYGKSRSYIYGRLKLLALCPQVRTAVLAGEIGSEVGLLIARVGDARMQAKALARIKSKYLNLEDGGAKSFRQIRDLLNEHFTLDLKSAIFDIEDEMLLPSAGHCLRCPKRSGNAPEFSDLVEPAGKADQRHFEHYGPRRHNGADVCTDPDCFDAKRKAHLAREAAKLQAEGKTVITGNAARAALGARGDVKGIYVALADVRGAIKTIKAAAKTVAKGAAKAGTQPAAAAAAAAAAPAEPPFVLIQDQRTGKTVQAVKRADLQAAGAKLPEATLQRNAGGRSPAEQARHDATEARQRTELQAENTRRRELLDRVRAATRASERTEADLRLVAAAALRGVEYGDRKLLASLWGDEDFDGVAKRAKAMDAADLTQLLLDCALVVDVNVRYHWEIERQKPEALLEMAGLYGVENT